MIEKIAMLRKKYNNKTKKTEWALLSRSKPHRVLKWFGARKPSHKNVVEEEKRIQYFKHTAENIITEMHKVSGNLRNKGIIHIADAVTNCIASVVRNFPQDENAIRLGKIIALLQKKGEANLAERLDALLPDILSCKEIEVDKFIEVDESEFKVRVSALRAYNIAKLLKEKYVSGELNASDFEYTKMKELETLLKTGFILPMPTTYGCLPKDTDNWWDHFEQKNE
jgi:hypothetical protein